MNVTCADCQAVFRIDPAKVPAAGVRARCSSCGSVLHITARAAAAAVPLWAPSVAPAVVSAWVTHLRAVFESEAEAAPEAFVPGFVLPPSGSLPDAPGRVRRPMPLMPPER